MNKIITENIEKINEYCKRYNVKELYAIGSVVNDNFKDDSDIDLLIKFDELSIEEYTDNYFILHNLFQDIFKRKVDLVTDKSLNNPYFIKSIDRTKKILYAR